MANTVMVTGGAGYIGSHTCVELLQAGYKVVVVDNLGNSKQEALNRVQAITGKLLTFYQADIRDKQALTDIFGQEAISTVIHFAGLKAVGESCEQPLRITTITFTVRSSCSRRCGKPMSNNWFLAHRRPFMANPRKSNIPRICRWRQSTLMAAPKR